MADIQRMGGSFEGPEPSRPFLRPHRHCACLYDGDYTMEVNVYSKGHGRLFLRLDGYRPCHNPDEVISSIGYDPDSDLDNPADSVFCSHGAGTIVKWDQVETHMDLDCVLRLDAESSEAPSAPRLSRSSDSPEVLDQESCWRFLSAHMAPLNPGTYNLKRLLVVRKN